MTDLLTAALDYDLDAAFTLCAQFMNDTAHDDGAVMPAADVLDGFEDAHGLEYSEAERTDLLGRLENVARAIATFGPAA